MLNAAGVPIGHLHTDDDTDDYDEKVDAHREPIVRHDMFTNAPNDHFGDPCPVTLN